MNKHLAVLTNDSEYADFATKPGFQWTLYTEGFLTEYLNASPRNAVVLSIQGGAAAIFRGASDEPTNFYYSALPVEDPNDADGGDLTAAEALTEASLMELVEEE